MWPSHCEAASTGVAAEDWCLPAAPPPHLSHARRCSVSFPPPSDAPERRGSLRRMSDSGSVKSVLDRPPAAATMGSTDALCKPAPTPTWAAPPAHVLWPDRTAPCEASGRYVGDAHAGPPPSRRWSCVSHEGAAAPVAGPGVAAGVTTWLPDPPMARRGSSTHSGYGGGGSRRGSVGPAPVRPLSVGRVMAAAPVYGADGRGDAGGCHRRCSSAGSLCSFASYAGDGGAGGGGAVTRRPSLFARSHQAAAAAAAYPYQSSLPSSLQDDEDAAGHAMASIAASVEDGTEHWFGAADSLGTRPCTAHPSPRRSSRGSLSTAEVPADVAGRRPPRCGLPPTRACVHCVPAACGGCAEVAAAAAASASSSSLFALRSPLYNGSLPSPEVPSGGVPLSPLTPATAGAPLFAFDPLLYRTPLNTSLGAAPPPAPTSTGPRPHPTVAAWRRRSSGSHMAPHGAPHRRCSARRSSDRASLVSTSLVPRGSLTGGVGASVRAAGPREEPRLSSCGASCTSLPADSSGPPASTVRRGCDPVAARSLRSPMEVGVGGGSRTSLRTGASSVATSVEPSTPLPSPAPPPAPPPAPRPVAEAHGVGGAGPTLPPRPGPRSAGPAVVGGGSGEAHRGPVGSGHHARRGWVVATNAWHHVCQWVALTSHSLADYLRSGRYAFTWLGQTRAYDLLSRIVPGLVSVGRRLLRPRGGRPAPLEPPSLPRGGGGGGAGGLLRTPSTRPVQSPLVTGQQLPNSFVSQRARKRMSPQDPRAPYDTRVSFSMGDSGGRTFTSPSVTVLDSADVGTLPASFSASPVPAVPLRRPDDPRRFSSLARKLSQTAGQRQASMASGIASLTGSPGGGHYLSGCGFVYNASLATNMASPTAGTSGNATGPPADVYGAGPRSTRRHCFSGSNALADYFERELTALLRHPPSTDFAAHEACFALYTQLREACGKGLPWEAVFMLLDPADAVYHTKLLHPLHFLSYEEFLQAVELVSVRHVRQHEQQRQHRRMHLASL